MDLNVESLVMNSNENMSLNVPFWNVDLPKSPWDMDEDLEDLNLLSELVRNQYLKRLRQTLLDNLDITEGYQKKHLYQIQQSIDICMAEMEKQALRRCMIASIYREGMSKMINEVKTCTKNSMLYALLKHIVESNNQLPLRDKYFKAENVIKNPNSIGTNTEIMLNKTASTQTEKWMVSNIPNNLSVKINNINTDLVNKSNLPPSSYDVKSKISESTELNIFKDLNSLLKSSSCFSSSSDIPMEINDEYDSNITSSNLHRNLDQENGPINNILSINALLKDLQDSPEYEQQSSEKRLQLFELATEDHKSTDNLSELPAPIYINPNDVRPQKISDILKDKIKSKRVAKSYEIQKCIKQLPQNLQIRLNKKFIDLFGEDHDYESDILSEEEERIIAHKRIVKMVVDFMTPYYKANRINRHLFKDLAKLISKNLMDQAYDPDEETVAKRVSEFFTENRCIKSVEDIYK